MFMKFPKKTLKEESMKNVVVVLEKIHYDWTCPKCSGTNKPASLIDGQYLQCWQCGLRIKRNENNLWEIG